MLTHKKELREVLTTLRAGKVTVDMAATIIEMIVDANMVGALARYPHPNPLSKSESGHISEAVKAEQVNSQ